MKKRGYSSAVRDAAAEATRGKILKAARDVLANGKLAFSLDTVAKRAGVTRLTIYNQFETKNGLIDAMFDDIAMRGGLDKLMDVFTDPDADKALRRMVSIFCAFWASNYGLVPRMALIVDPEIVESVRERNGRRRIGLGALVSRMLTKQSAQVRADLIDTLFALTSFDFYKMIATGERTQADTERLIQDNVAAAVERAKAARK